MTGRAWLAGLGAVNGWDMQRVDNLVRFRRGGVTFIVTFDSMRRTVAVTSNTHKLNTPAHGKVKYIEDIICGRITLDRLSE